MSSVVGMEAVFALGCLADRNSTVEISGLPEVFLTTVYLDRSAPYARALMPTDPGNTGSIVAIPLPVSLVLGITDDAQVTDAVVFGVAVYVIYLIFGPASVVKRPRDPVVLIQLCVYLS